jgi:hypothetical protein
LSCDQRISNYLAFQFMNMSVPDEGYSWNDLCALNLISTFLFLNILFNPFILVSNKEFQIIWLFNLSTMIVSDEGYSIKKNIECTKLNMYAFISSIKKKIQSTIKYIEKITYAFIIFYYYNYVTCCSYNGLRPPVYLYTIRLLFMQNTWCLE